MFSRAKCQIFRARARELTRHALFQNLSIRPLLDKPPRIELLRVLVCPVIHMKRMKRCGNKGAFGYESPVLESIVPEGVTVERSWVRSGPHQFVLVQGPEKGRKWRTESNSIDPRALPQETIQPPHPLHTLLRPPVLANHSIGFCAQKRDVFWICGQIEDRVC